MKTLQQIYTTAINNSNSSTHTFQHYNTMGTLHSYTPIFSNLFSNLRDKEVSMLSLGYGNGSEANIWLEYFSDLTLTGIENNIKLQQESTIKEVNLIYKDILLEETANSITSTFDIILHDFPSSFIHYITSINLYSEKLKEGGMFVLQDIYDIDINRESYKNHIESKGLTFEVYDLRDIKGRFDDVLIVGRKPFI